MMTSSKKFYELRLSHHLLDLVAGDAEFPMAAIYLPRGAILGGFFVLVPVSRSRLSPVDCATLVVFFFWVEILKVEFSKDFSLVFNLYV